jgi:hypothetical protein
MDLGPEEDLHDHVAVDEGDLFLDLGPEEEVNATTGQYHRSFFTSHHRLCIDVPLIPDIDRSNIRSMLYNDSGCELFI